MFLTENAGAIFSLKTCTRMYGILNLLTNHYLHSTSNVQRFGKRYCKHILQNLFSYYCLLSSNIHVEI